LKYADDELGFCCIVRFKSAMALSKSPFFDLRHGAAGDLPLKRRGHSRAVVRARRKGVTVQHVPRVLKYMLYLRVIRGEPLHGLEVRDGFGVVVRLVQNIGLASVVIRVYKAGIQPYRLIEIADGLAVIFQFKMREPPVGVRHGGIGRHLDQPGVIRGRLLVAALFQ